jgi:hypothetical protein
MSKRSSKKSKRRSKALPALGFAGVSLSMASGACASTTEASANTPPTSQSQDYEIFLGEEEIFDTSLSTFYTFDKENAGQTSLAQQLKLARGGGCGCGHGGGCGGHGGGCGGHGGCGGCGGRGCAGGVHVGCGGCHMGCGGCRGFHAGCRGFHVACRGFHHVACRSCRCGHHFFRRGCGGGGCGGCGGCGGSSCWIWTPGWGWVNACWAESTPAAEVSSVAPEQSAQTAEITVKGDGNIDRTRTK